MAMQYGIRGEDDEEWDDFFRDWLPPAFSSFHYLTQGEFGKFFRAYTPEFPFRMGARAGEEVGLWEDMGKWIRRNF